MLLITAELSYYADGSNFNLQGLPHAVLELVRTYLGDHYGPVGFRNVLVYAERGRGMLMVVANSRFFLRRICATANSRSSIGRPAESYINHAQCMEWRLTYW